MYSMSSPLPVVKGFSSIEPPRARVLILGSMPGPESLKRLQYYGHPWNAFWPIMAEVLHTDCPNQYDKRLEMLCTHDIALWDVLAECNRVGASDSTIRDAVPNDFTKFWKRQRAIELVVCNGTTAYNLAKRFSILPSKKIYGRTVRMIRLPSTSRAHTMKYSEKLSCWNEAFQLLNDFLPR